MSNHDLFMKDYRALNDLLTDFMDGDKPGDTDPGEVQDKPLADEYLMESVFEGLKEAADAMDSDSIAEIMKELEEFAIPADQRAKYDAVCECASKYDYEGILKALG